MRVLLWHGWLLEGSGSNVYTARVAEVLRSSGHDVLVVCQEPHPDRYPWIDAWGSVGADGPSALTTHGASPSSTGRCVLLRPRIGRLLPVFVLDEYEGFEVERFVDLSDEKLEAYLGQNVEALRAAAAWHRSDVVVAGHAIPGAVVARRALGPRAYIAKVHGSDLEYAIGHQRRYADLAREGLAEARAVVGSSPDVLARAEVVVPGIGPLLRPVPPGVDAHRFRPMPRREALLRTAAALETDPDTARGRPASLDLDVQRAVERREPGALDALAHRYDQEVPDPDAAGRLRELAGHEGPVVGYFGKLIPAKGVELLLAAARLTRHRPSVLVVGFGLHREWLGALAAALRAGDAESAAWLREAGAMPLERDDVGGEAAGAPVTFTGRLDHRYAPGALAALDILVVPSVLSEAFGMVTSEGAAAGALPLVAGHTGLGQTGAALEQAAGHPGLFTYEPGSGSATRIAAGVDRILSLPPEERLEIGREVRAFIVAEWSWRRTAERLLEAWS
ncbi:MAG: glycosyltransferase family 4 protein [Actinomycetota bacterium]